jgi:ADP-heptose:LPS heptosyltransferase
MTLFAGIPNRSGYATPKRRLFLTHPVGLPETELHKADYFLNIAKALGGDTSRKTCEFFVNSREREYIEKELSKNGVRGKDLLVVMNPGGNWPPKRWSEENFSKLGDLLAKGYKAKIVISGASGDTKRATRIAGRMKERPVLFTGKTNLKELAALMERADFVVSGDSGPAHIACAMGSSVIVLFGPTSPELTGPYKCANSRVIQKSLDCERPCYDTSCRNYECMDSIETNDVLAAFEDMYDTYRLSKEESGR